MKITNFKGKISAATLSIIFANTGYAAQNSKMVFHMIAENQRLDTFTKLSRVLKDGGKIYGIVRDPTDYKELHNIISNYSKCFAKKSNPKMMDVFAKHPPITSTSVLSYLPKSLKLEKFENFSVSKMIDFSELKSMWDHMYPLSSFSDTEIENFWAELLAKNLSQYDLKSGNFNYSMSFSKFTLLK